MSDFLGLEKGTVKLTPYNSKWKDYFETEKDFLLKRFLGVFLEISHGGSTSVPGMKAKPIIDMFVSLEQLDDYVKVKTELEELGYEYRGEEHVPGRQLFVKGPPECRTHNLQLTTKDDEQWTNHILLREYYIKHPDVAREYESLKETLAEKYPNDRRLYSKGKSDFIDSVLKIARVELA